MFRFPPRNLILLALASPALCLQYDDYSTWTGGIPSRVDAAVSGDLMVCTGVYAQTETVFTYRIGEGGQTSLLDQRSVIGVGDIGRVVVQGDYAWALMDDSGDDLVQGFNLEDPADIQLLSTTPLTSFQSPMDLIAVPGWLVVLYYNQYTTIPVLPGGGLGEPVDHSLSWASRISSEGDLLLMPTPGGGAARRVLANGALQTVCVFPAGLDIHRAALSGSEYVFAATDSQGPGLFVYDSTCTNELARLPLDTVPTRLRANDRLIVTGTGEGLSMYATDRGTLSPLGSTRLTDELLRICWLDEDFLVCLWRHFPYDCLAVAELRPAGWLEVEPVTSMPTTSDMRMLALEPDKLLFGDTSGVLYLLDTGISMPEPQSLLSFEGAAWPIWQENGLLAVSHGVYGGFSLLDASDIRNPVLLSHTSTPDTPRDAVRAGDLLFVADDGLAGYQSGVRIFDITDPLEPVHLGRLDTDQSGFEVALQDSLLLVRGGLLELFDVRNPRAPVSLETLGTPPEYINDAEFVGGFLVTLTWMGLKVYSLPDLEEVDAGWGGVDPKSLVPDRSGFYVIDGDSWNEGMVLRFSLAADGQLIHHGGFGFLETRMCCHWATHCGVATGTARTWMCLLPCPHTILWESPGWSWHMTGAIFGSPVQVPGCPGTMFSSVRTPGSGRRSTGFRPLSGPPSM